MVTVIFECRHKQSVDPDAKEQRVDPSRVNRPCCAVCGNAKILRVIGGKPRISGVS